MAEKTSSINQKFKEAVNFHRNGQFGKAESLYEQILTEDSSYTQAYGNLTDTFIQQGKLDLALMRLNRAEGQFPNDATILTAQCALYSKMGNLEKGIDYAKKALEIKPKSADLHINIAGLYYRLQFFDEALKFFQKTIELNPLFTEAHFNIGTLKYNKGNLAGARNAFRKVIKQAPKSYNAYLNMGQIYTDEGRYDMALKYLNKVLELEPNQGQAYQRIGMIDHFQGDLESALKNYKTAQKNGVTGIEILFLLGNVNKDIGDTDQAVLYYRKVLEIDPNNSDAKKNLSQVSGSKISHWHFEMLADSARNEAYYKAIKKVIKEGSTVLDIGTGSGLLAMMAAKSGAKEVCACEMVPILASTAKNIIEINGLKEIVNVIHKKSTALKIGEDLSKKANVIVSEILDSGLLGEGVFPSLRDVITNLATKNATIIPKSADVYGVLIESAHLKNVNPLKDICGFDLSPFDALREKSPYHRILLNQVPHQRLSEVFPVHGFDFYNIPQPFTEKEPFKKTIKIQASKDGLVHAVAFWFTLHLDDEISLSSGPSGEMIHWGQALCFFKEERKIKKGESIELIMNQSDISIWFE